MSDSPSTVELLERLARLEEALTQRDTRIKVLTRRVAELEALLRKNSRTSSKPPSSDGPVKRLCCVERWQGQGKLDW